MMALKRVTPNLTIDGVETYDIALTGQLHTGESIAASPAPTVTCEHGEVTASTIAISVEDIYDDASGQTYPAGSVLRVTLTATDAAVAGEYWAEIVYYGNQTPTTKRKYRVLVCVVEYLE